MNRTGQQIAIAAVTALACALALPANGQPVIVTGTRVAMTPPDGFVAAVEFPGFQQPENLASIMVTELPVPAPEMKRGMTKSALATRGMTLLAASNEQVGGDHALLLHVTQKAGGRDFLKWMLIGGDPGATVMIVATYPKTADAELGASLRRSLLGAEWTNGARPDPFDGLLFRVDPTPNLKIAGRVSNVLMLTDTGTTSIGPDGAIYGVANSIGQGEIADLRSFSEQRAKKTTNTAALQNMSGTFVTVDGLNSYELMADGKDEKTGRRIKLYQVIVPDRAGYFIIQGIVALERAPEFVPEFRQITGTFRRTGR